MRSTNFVEYITSIGFTASGGAIRAPKQAAIVWHSTVLVRRFFCLLDAHGRDLPIAGMRGKLSVLNGSAKTEVPLEAGSGNMLVAQADASLAKGAKTVRFPIK